MKVSKLKTLLYFLGVSIVFTTISVDAASINIDKSKSSTDDTAIFEIYLDASDGEVSNKTLKIQANASGITPTITKADNAGDIICNSDACALPGPYTSKLKVAEVTLKNTTSSDIENAYISASIEGIGNVTSESVILKADSTKTTTAKVQSKNAELTNLTTSVGSLDKAFSTGERSYMITGIKDTVNSITFNTTCENCTTKFTCLENCTIAEGKNNRIMLGEGSNSIELVTTSEDGSNSITYSLEVYRGEIEKPSAYLKSLKIKDVELDTKFDMLLNDYTTTVDLDVNKLEIDYELEDPKATVKITGNENFKEGENTVTITVTSSDGASKQVYTIVVNKEDICDPEKEDCEKDANDTQVVEKKKTNKVILIIGIVVGALAIIGVSAYFLFFKKKKNDKNNKNDKNGKSEKKNKLKNAFIEEEIDDQEETVEIKENVESEAKEEIIKPRIKPTVDEALEDLMKTKEIELNCL